ncbi:MAG: EAL domain-containing protein [Ectothiorhodospiraceae bacterium]|nr:EAL domain-containing protein [Chromatiales bacterium]MCP5154753.1 EAL domain-containing protein [Ectothiorhodospiraceae bacterium]
MPRSSHPGFLVQLARLGAFKVALVGAFLGGMALALFSVFEELRLGLASDVERAGAAVDEVVSEVTTTLLRAEFLGVEPCSPEGLMRLRRAVLEATHIRDVGIFRGEQMRCTTALGALEPPFTGPPADHRLAYGFDVWLRPKLVGSRLVDAIVIRRGEANVVLDPRHFELLPEASDHQTAVLLRPLREPPVTIAGSLPGELGSGDVALTTELASRTVGRHVTATRCSRGFEICVVGTRAWPAALGERWPRVLASGIAATLVTAFLVGLIAWQVERLLRGPVRLRRAIRDRALYLAYQPLLDLHSGHLVGAEALVRGRGPGEATISAAEVLSWARDDAASAALACHVATLALTDLGDVLRDRPGFLLSINLELEDVAAPSVQSTLRALAAEHRLTRGQVAIEVTERGEWSRPAVQTGLARLRAAGYAIAIDDFGAGSSNIDRVAGQLADIVKIDKSLVQGSFDGSVPQSMLIDLVGLVHGLGRRVILEGIETEAHLEHCRAHLRGVTAQGWWLGHPLPRDAFLANHGHAGRPPRPGADATPRPAGTRDGLLTPSGADGA